jgi:hypothetical protein
LLIYSYCQFKQLAFFMPRSGLDTLPRAWDDGTGHLPGGLFSRAYREAHTANPALVNTRVIRPALRAPGLLAHRQELLKIRARAGGGFDSARYGQAVALFSEVALAVSFPEFLTIPAYERMP